MKQGGWLILVMALCLLAVLALGRCGTTAQVYPTWTPRPTNTPRVYNTWTLVPSATRKTVTPTLGRSPTPTFDGMPPTVTATPKSCSQPWPYTTTERIRILAGALYYLHGGTEADLDPFTDPILGIGCFQEALGAPLSIEFAVEADNGLGLIRARAFCAAIVAVREMPGLDDTCVNYALVGYNGQQGQ